MIERILDFSVRHRWLVLLLTLAAAFGVWSLTKLPIDAVPDITNNQVQINTVAPALSPVEIEKQVTFPIETALAGIPGLEYTRSLSRNGFSQVTAVFTDRTDIYFARQQVIERLTEASRACRPASSRSMGPISTGLGEIYMWTVEYAPPGRAGAGARRQAGLAERRQLSDARRRAPHRRRRTHRLSAHRAGLDHPAADEDRAGRGRRRRHRRLRKAVPGPARPGEAGRATACPSA